MIPNAKRHRRSAVGARALERDSSARAGQEPHRVRNRSVGVLTLFWLVSDINCYVRTYLNVTDSQNGDIRTTAGVGGVDFDAQCNTS
jgi:hypothetical protein